MKYKVTIQELTPDENATKYNRYETNTIYEQAVDGLDIKAVVDVVNKVNACQVAPIIRKGTYE